MEPLMAAYKMRHTGFSNNYENCKIDDLPEIINHAHDLAIASAFEVDVGDYPLLVYDVTKYYISDLLQKK